MLANAPVHAIVPCVDMERARKFYGQVLGLQEIEIPGIAEEMRESEAMYACGDGTHLMIYQRPEPTKAEHTAAGWVVDDIAAVVDALIAKGVTMERYDMPGVEFDERGVATAGDMKGAWFKDPEGNILVINQLPGEFMM
jgi:catechol 2,3-dioxygenase-like lactoylglutathione lyase family enzyme